MSKFNGNGFIKLHRDVRQHWVHSRPDWFYAWSNILMATQHKTSRVNLTEVYENLKPFMTEDKWQYLVKKLKKEGMLEACETVNEGPLKGKIAFATVTNYAKFHGKNSADAVHGSITGGSADAEHQKNPENTGTYEGEEDTIAGGSADVLTGGSAGEYKEITIPYTVFTTNTPPTEREKEGIGKSENVQQPQPPSSPSNALVFFRKFLGAEADWMAKKIDLEHQYEVWGEEALKNLWRECVTLNRQKAGDKAKFRFQDALSGILETNTKPLGVSAVKAGLAQLTEYELKSEMDRARLVASETMPSDYLRYNKFVTSLEVYHQVIREQGLS